MSIEQLKQQILMLRRQRAAVQVQIARAVQSRHATIIEFDKDIADKTTIALDFDMQIAEETRKYTTILANGAAPNTDDKPRRPLGAVGTMIEVHPTMAHIYDAVTTAGVYTVPKALNAKNEAIVNKFCGDLVALGIARWNGNSTLVPQSLSKLQNPVGMPEPRK